MQQPHSSEDAEAPPSLHGVSLNPRVSEAEDAVRALMLEKLRQMDQQREAERQRRLEDRNEAADPRESIKAFLTEFEGERKRLEASIADVTSAGPRPAGAEADAARASLDSLATEVSTAEARLSRASYFLPAYDQRSCAACVAALKQQIEDARAAVLPRKKFAFSKREGSTRSAAPQGAATPAAPASDAASGNLGQAAALLEAAAAEPAALPDVAPGMGLRGLRGETLIVGPRELDNKDYWLVDLDSCTLYLLGALRAVRLHRIRSCSIYVCAVRGSCFLDDVTCSEVHVASHQVRVHSTIDSTLCLRAKSRPIVEHCKGVRVAPFGLRYPGAQAQLAAAGLGAETGMWREVDDFGWIKAVRSPNWSELDEERWPSRDIPPDLLEIMAASERQGRSEEKSNGSNLGSVSAVAAAVVAAGAAAPTPAPAPAAAAAAAGAAAAAEDDGEI